MEQYYNHNVFLLFIGGLFSLILTITVLFVKQTFKRELERKHLEAEKEFRPEEIGDVEAKLNDSIDFKKVNIFQQLTLWGIQPLLIISFASLFNQSSEIEIIGAFSLIILTLFHEFYLADRYSRNFFYQLSILIVWVFFFAMISNKANIREQTKVNIDKTTK